MENKEDTDCSFNDDEIFFGRLTLKEVKKRIFMDVNQKYLSTLDSCDVKNYDNNDFKIIEASSQPNMRVASVDKDRSAEHLKSSSDPYFNRKKQHIEPKLKPDPDFENQDSFLELEEKVTEQCKSPYKYENLDNTLEFVDFILNHAQSHEKNMKATNIIKKDSSENNKMSVKDEEAPKDENLSQLTTHNRHNKEESDKGKDNNIERVTHVPITPIKCEQIETFPVSKTVKCEASSTLNTPVSMKKEVSNIFKTPKMPLSSRKDTGAKKTPSRSKAYEHIASPIATYIRNSPQVPLVKDVRPKKPLPNASLIPKLLKNIPEHKSDKENVVLPPLAYRSAKKTLVIDESREKLPQSNWAKKLTPSKPVVIKHNHREAGKIPLSLKQQEDSFQDLTLHQADVSVCTQKLAFQKL